MIVLETLDSLLAVFLSIRLFRSPLALWSDQKALSDEQVAVHLDNDKRAGLVSIQV